MANFNGKHGHNRVGKRTSEYKCWDAIIQRTLNPNDNNYFKYGARGITVCKEWMQFGLFLYDMGLKPSPKHQIDRIDNNKGYYKENCRWVTPSENIRNTRRTRKVILKGETLCFTDAVKRFPGMRGKASYLVHEKNWTHQRTIDHLVELFDSVSKED